LGILASLWTMLLLHRLHMEGPKRFTIISSGFVQTNLADSITDPTTKAQIAGTMEKIAIPPDAIARATAFAIEQPADVDVGGIIVRPTAQARIRARSDRMGLRKQWPIKY
jgi:NADP-dependent 3-hydroxy acid dehydrogenase YdfG